MGIPDAAQPRALTIDQCLERLAAGDLTARDRLVELFAERLRELAHKLLRNYPGVRRHDDTDDVFQNAVMRLYRALGQMAANGQSPRSVMALGAAQIHRELIDLARRYTAASSYHANHGTNVYDDGSEPRHFIDDALSEEEPFDRWEAFHAAVERLSPEQRETFRFVWYLGADQKTVAAALGCSERTVKNYWREAREAVRAALEGERPD